MNVGVIDADLIGRKNHRFPNLALMKISGFHGGAKLLLSYDEVPNYEKVYISKVFTDTPFPELIRYLPNVELGGTGFFFDKAEPLPYEVEHSKPDYELYNEWLKDKPRSSAFKEFRDYSIGFTTRGCFRKCGFCVNKKYNRVFRHSPLKEFLEPSRKKICLLDDNIFGFKEWASIWHELEDTGKPFKYKQGMDERLLNAEKCKVIFKSKYDGFYTFAFDNIRDYDLIQRKLELIRNHTDKRNIMFYVLCGYESTGLEDIENTFKRIELLIQYGCLPYIMRYQSENTKPWQNSEFKEVYNSIARWCNQPSLFKTKSFVEFCELTQREIRTPGKLCSSMRALESLKGKIADKYLYMKWKDTNE